MKSLLITIITFLPTLAMAHEGHGNHLMYDTTQLSVAGFSVELLLVGLLLASVAVLLIKKYKSRH